jgi:RNA polymerase sigma-70 factor, ECF subfamily
MVATTEQLWLGLHDRLLRTIRRHVADDQCAEDILQEVFLKVHLRIGTLRDEERLEHWVYQIVRNAITDHHRRQRPSAPLPEELAAPDGASEDDSGAVARQLVPFVKATVAALPEPYREALLLTEYAGLTQQQLAERAGISLSGAKSRVQRAREKVKSLLLACCHIELDRRGGILDEQPLCDTCACNSCASGDGAGCAPA